MAHAESTYKVIEYIIDPSQNFIGRVPEGRTVKTFTGKNAFQKASEHCNKLNKESDKDSKVIKGYFVKGDLVVESRIPNV